MRGVIAALGYARCTKTDVEKLIERHWELKVELLIWKSLDVYYSAYTEKADKVHDNRPIYLISKRGIRWILMFSKVPKAKQYRRILAERRAKKKQEKAGSKEGVA